MTNEKIKEVGKHAPSKVWNQYWQRGGQNTPYILPERKQEQKQKGQMHFSSLRALVSSD